MVVNRLVLTLIIIASSFCGMIFSIGICAIIINNGYQTPNPFPARDSEEAFLIVGSCLLLSLITAKWKCVTKGKNNG